MPKVAFSYVAVKPIRAEHPVGSGVIVEYAPGDVIPAGEWGRAADNLVELGKAARLAINVPDEVDLVVEVAEPEPEAEMPEAPAPATKRPRKKAE